MNDTMSMSNTIVVEIDIAAPPERVFKAWIDPQQRLAWWGDDATYRSTKLDSDLRVGGKWRTEGKKGTEGKPFSVSGEYTRVDPPRALGFTWNADWTERGLPETHVLIELTPTSSGTHVTLTHSGFASVQSRDDHNKGWQRVLAWLRSYLQTD
jgi:uncharacterized protein YndB with AHSA1/START domain